jgi:hypothetical protein
MAPPRNTSGGTPGRPEIFGREATPASLRAGLAGPTHERRHQRYALTVWSRDADKRVDIARAGARHGASCFDHDHTGNDGQRAGSYLAISEEIDEAAAARGVGRSEVLEGLKALSSELCGRWGELKIEDC